VDTPRSLRANFNLYRTKAGPNGHSLVTSIADALAMPSELKNSLAILGGPKLGYTLKKVLVPGAFLGFLSKYINWGNGKEFRRLAFFSDKEGKTRVVGIID